MQFEIIPVTAFQQNCSLIWCENTRQAALVDPGGDIERLLQVVKARDVILSKVILTHGHLDHVGGTADLQARFDLPIEGPHRDDAFWIEALAEQARMLGLPPVPGFAPDRWLNEGDKVHVGDIELQVRHCPGHTPGHIIFYHAPSAQAFVGDVLFHGSIGRSDFPRGNHDHLINSIRTKLFPLGDHVRFVPGHGPTSTFGDERLHNPFVADKRFG